MNRDNEPFRFVEFSYRDIPPAIWEAWMDCARAWHAEPFRAPTWVRDQPWMASSIPRARLLVGMDAQDNYLGFWPYQIESKRIRGFLPIRLCCPWGGDNQGDPGVGGHQYFWALCSFDPPFGFATAFVAAFMERTRWNVLQTGDVPDNHPLALAWEEELHNKHLRILRKQHNAAVIGTWDSFENYLASLSRKFRYQYRKLQKRIDSGEISVEQLAAFPGDALDRVIERIGSIYRDSWKVGSQEAAVNLALADTLSNFSARISAFAREGGLHVVFITVDGDDAAFRVGVSHGDMFCGLQVAYREKYASYGVGFLALIESNRYLIGRKIHAMNLLDYTDYKKHFGAEVSLSTLYTVFSRDAIGNLAWHARGLSNLVRTIIQQIRKGFAFFLPPGLFSSRKWKIYIRAAALFLCLSEASKSKFHSSINKHRGAACEDSPA